MASKVARSGYYEEIDGRFKFVHAPNASEATKRPWLIHVDGVMLRTKSTEVGRRFGTKEAARKAAMAALSAEVAPTAESRPKASTESWRAAERVLGGLGVLIAENPDDGDELREMADRIREMYP